MALLIRLISIVFSVWRKTLDIASEMCRRYGIAVVRIDGSVPQRERSLALEKFSKDSSEEDAASVLLITLGTGALGHVHLERISAVRTILTFFSLQSKPSSGHSNPYS